MSDRLLVACVGNVLRGDDGFGVAVAARLGAEELSAGTTVIETGIGGVAIVHELMAGYDALVVVDSVDHAAEPGAVTVFEPDVADPAEVPLERWRQLFDNLHLAEPSRVLLLARALGVLPARVIVVGCQPASSEEFGEGLSEPARAAVDIAARRVRELSEQLIGVRGAR